MSIISRHKPKHAIPEPDAETVAREFADMNENRTVPFGGAISQEEARLPRRPAPVMTGPQRSVRYQPPDFGTLDRVRGALRNLDADRTPVYDRLYPRLLRYHAGVPGKAMLPVRARRVAVARARIANLAYPACDGFSEPEGYAELMRAVSRLTGTASPLERPGALQRRRAITSGEHVPPAALTRPQPTFTPRDEAPQPERRPRRVFRHRRPAAWWSA